MDSCARGPSTTRTSRGPAQRRGPAEGGLRWEATTPWSTWRRICDPEKVFKKSSNQLNEQNHVSALKFDMEMQIKSVLPTYIKMCMLT